MLSTSVVSSSAAVIVPVAPSATIRGLLVARTSSSLKASTVSTTRSLAIAPPFTAVNSSSYIPACEKLTVVLDKVGSEKVADPGPDTKLQVINRLEGTLVITSPLITAPLAMLTVTSAPA